MKPERNDLCPCGSGKKYKKCCGAAGSGHSAGSLPSAERASSLFARSELTAAADEVQAVLARAPDDPDALHLAGLIQAQMGHNAEARVFLERAAMLIPDNAFVHSNYACVLRDLGLTDAAVAAAERALAIDSRMPDAHNNLANALKDQGAVPQAVAHYRQAVLLAPESPAFQENLAAALIETGDTDGAEAVWRSVLERAAKSAAAFAGLGEVAVQRAHWSEARTWFNRAIEAGSRDPRVFNSLGRVCEELKDYQQAFEHFKQALALDPEQPGVWYNLGYVLDQNENQPAALRAYQEAYQRGLRSTDIKVVLLNALASLRQVERAHALAMTLLPEAVREPALLPPLLKTFGMTCDFTRLETIWRRLDAAIDMGTLDPHSIDISLMLSCYPDFIGEERLLAHHRAWGELIEARITPLPAATNLPRASGSRLRVGYLSPDIRKHSVGFFIQHVLAHHDRRSVEVFCYSSSRDRDSVTEYVEQHVEHFVEVRDLEDRDLAKRIRSDGIDILIDLAGHTGGHRLTVFPYRPAPVAMTWIGYLHTTGLNSVDYRISDPFADPDQGGSGIERLLRLPQSFLCIGNLPEVEIQPEPACLRTGHVTFGSFNNLQKLNRSVIHHWSRILAGVPNSRLVIMAQQADASVVASHLVPEFERHGIDAGRIELRASRPHLDYLRFHNEVDLLLDTFPFSGGTVTASALWMGVPVVTLVGPTHRQRVSYSMLRNIDVDETIAWNEEEYVQAAVRLASDPQRLLGLRQRIARNTRASVLCDAPRFTRQLETALQHVWEAYCAEKEQSSAVGH